MAQFIRIIIEERALLSPWRVKFHIAVEHGNLIFDPSGLVSEVSVDLVPLTFDNQSGVSDQDTRLKETLLNLL